MAEVSIIVPVYNTDAFLRRCLDSIVNQTFDDIEIVVVNDGSTDNSAEIIAEYAARDSRIKVITQDNQGLGAARNAGIRAASGTYLTCIDSDDVAKPQMVELLYATLLENDADISMCQLERVLYREDGSKSILGKLSLPGADRVVTGAEALQMQLDMVSLVMGSACCKLVKRSSHVDNDIWYPTKHRFSEDGVTCVRMYTSAGRVALLHEYLYEYVQTGESLTSSYSLKKADDLLTDIKEIEEVINATGLQVFSDNFLLANLFSAGKQVEWANSSKEDKSFIKKRIKEKSRLLHPNFSRKEMPLMYKMEAAIAHLNITSVCCKLIQMFKWMPAVRRKL